MTRNAPVWKEWSVHEVAPDITARITREMPALPASVNARVEALWQTARAADPSLFNGSVFSADSITPHVITGHFTEFRRLVAQIRDPALHMELGLRPLAVSGVLRCRTAGGRGLVFGRRRPGAVYQAGLWQLPPAGSVDETATKPGGIIDLHYALLTELVEELGLPAESVRIGPAIALIEHPDSRVLDLGMLLETDWDGEAVQHAHAARGNDEYTCLRILNETEIEAASACFSENLAPQTRILLNRVATRAD
jgi:8-oxo-dGTP pyrophosphatase MutT (NUDIX family)